MRIARLAVILALLLPFLALVPGTARGGAAVTYTITDLGTLGGDASRSYVAYQTNDAGQVLGYVNGAAFIWQQGVMTPLAPMVFEYWSLGLSESGTVTGRAFGRAHLWQDGTLTDLGFVGYPRAINAANEVVGSLHNSSRAFVWRNGSLTDLGTLPGMNTSDAWAINALGQIVGVSYEQPPDQFPVRDWNVVLWENGSIRNLGFTGWPSGINDRGQVVGTRMAPEHAFSYDRGTMTDLGTLGGPRSAGASINNAGQIVGSSDTAGGARHAFLASGGTLVDLNRLLPPGSGWELIAAMGINNLGQIVGTGRINGRNRAFLMSPSDLPPQAKPLPLGTAPRCFAETGQCTRSIFADYWAAHGGLAISGYPLSGEFTEVLEDGKPYRVQYFERVRMEYHPEATDPAYRVQLGQFGRKLHPADPAAPDVPGTTPFPATGHNVPPDFLAYWQAHGGLPQFGYPLTEVLRETLEDGNTYEVQYFERARFERHPENPPPYNILLGQFGRRILGNR